MAKVDVVTKDGKIELHEKGAAIKVLIDGGKPRMFRLSDEFEYEPFEAHMDYLGSEDLARAVKKALSGKLSIAPDEDEAAAADMIEEGAPPDEDEDDDIEADEEDE
jgi:hypothetical protein